MFASNDNLSFKVSMNCNFKKCFLWSYTSDDSSIILHKANKQLVTYIICSPTIFSMITTDNPFYNSKAKNQNNQLLWGPASHRYHVGD